MMALKIRKRERRGYSKEADGHDKWTEFQIVDGRKVLGRYELISQAESALAKLQTTKQDTP